MLGIAKRILRRTTLAWALFLGLSYSLALAEPPEGRWTGTIQIPGSPLAVEVDLVAKDGAWSGDISIPAQNAKDLPLGSVTVQDRNVSFVIAGVPGEPKFSGLLSENGLDLTGDFTQGGQKFAFQLKTEAAASEAASQANAKALDGFDAVVEKALKDFEVPGAAIGIVRDGKVILVKGYGVRDLDKQTPVTPKTVFAIGSATKAFTTFVMAQLVEEGKLDWEKPVTSFLPGFQLYDRVTTELITPRDLVTHRSGLPRHDLLWYNGKLSRREMVERLQYLEPNEKLRAKFQYNNAMFLTAGYLIEQVTKKSWEDNVRSRIFKPLGMTRSNFSVNDSKKSDDFAVPHSKRQEKLQTIPFRAISNVGPAGSINSTVEDMAQWMLLHLGHGPEGLLQPGSLADLHTPYMPIGGIPERAEISPMSYALGWMVNTHRGHPRIQHGGGIDGFITMVSMFPQDKLGIVIFVNADTGNLPELLTRVAFDRLAGLEPIDWLGESLARRKQGEALEDEAKTKKQTTRKSNTKPAHPLADYAGRYEHPGYGTLLVKQQGETLEMTYNEITAPLEHWHYEVFNATEGAKDPVFESMKFLFQTDVNGEVVSVSAPFEPQVADIVFQKKPDDRLFEASYLKRYTGEYDLGGQTFTVGLEGKVLTVSIPGQPTYHLVPGLGGRFTLKEYSIIGVVFLAEGKGPATAMQLHQPEGVYTAQRKQKADAKAAPPAKDAKPQDAQPTEGTASPEAEPVAPVKDGDLVPSQEGKTAPADANQPTPPANPAPADANQPKSPASAAPTP